jgi:phosphoribosyl-ATP pyrophosphohydrolase/phosphoribosyl-AMP cyclohydrolase/histidinol dehydrogenase
MSEVRLERRRPDQVASLRRMAVDADTLAAAATIVEDVRLRGESAVREHAERLGDLPSGAALVANREDMARALASLDPADRALLERTADRIRAFAMAQRDGLRDLDIAIPGGRAGHAVRPMEVAGCYAPGGRFPLPSSVLMTAVTARAAGVKVVWVASPRPSVATLAAAAVADADAVLCVGGAQAIAALAFGAGPVPKCDVVVGPGNRWVTAAKQLVAGHVAIDMLAGPSELVILADASADPDWVAADLLGQAEHDPDALPVLVTTAGEAFTAQVDAALERRLADLPTAPIARVALASGFAVPAPDIASAVDVCNRLAPEHLEVMTAHPEAVAREIDHFGAVFLGARSAEVFGDYGAGPNHVLPTGGTARSMGGLSVMTFLRVRTWLSLEAGPEADRLAADAVRLARIEGLEAHARAAQCRLDDRDDR